MTIKHKHAKVTCVSAGKIRNMYPVVTPSYISPELAGWTTLPICSATCSAHKPTVLTSLVLWLDNERLRPSTSTRNVEDVKSFLLILKL